MSASGSPYAPHAALLREFQAFEERMRGHDVWPHRVALEPLFRPLFRAARTPKAIVDDGRSPGIFDGQRDRASTTSVPEDAMLSEPSQRVDVVELVELQLLVPRDFGFKPEVARRLLNSLSGAASHLAFELIGAPEGVVVQLCCADTDRPAVLDTLRAFFPDIKSRVEENFLLGEFEKVDGVGVILNLGLKYPAYGSLRTEAKLEVDPLLELVGRLDRMKEGELGIVQILFSAARAPWGEELKDFVSRVDDVDKILPQIKEKFADPLFAAAVRLVAVAEDQDVAAERIQQMATALVATTCSDQNELEGLIRAEDSFQTELEDLLARETRRSGMILSLSELVSIVHPPSASVRSDRLFRLDGRTKAAPSIARGHRFSIGINESDEGTTDVSLSVEQRLRHVYTIGASGTGKSTLLLSMAIQDIEAGNGFAVLDPHGDLVEDILARIPEERAKDVILFDPADEAYPIGFNILSAHSELERTLLASDLVSVFKRLCTSFGDVMVSVLGNAVLAFLESSEGGTLLDLRNFLIDKTFRAKVLRTVQDEEVVSYWEREFPLLKGVPHAPVLTRLNTFLRPKLVRRMVAQQRDRLGFRQIMDSRTILLAKLSQGAIGEENSYLLGSLLVSKLTQAAMSRQNIETADREPYILYIDEFHHFVTPSIATILSGARKYGLGLVLAHQEMRQLKSRSEEVAGAVLANAATRVVFRVGEQDAKALSDGFSFFQAKDFQSLDVGNAIARVERADFDFNLRTVQAEPVAPDVSAARRRAVVSASRATYATPSDEVDASLATAREKHEGTQQPSGQRYREKANTVDIETTESRPGRGGPQHKYLQSFVKKVAEDRGFTVSLEHRVLDGHGHVDVLLERDGTRIGCEISVSTRARHEVENLTKCLAAGMDYAVLVSTKIRVQRIAREMMSTDDADRLRFLSPDDLIHFLDELSGGEEKRAAEANTPAANIDASATESADEARRSAEADVAESPEANSRMLLARDAARYLGLATQTLAKLRLTGGSPPYYKVGRQVLYRRNDLDAWLASRRRQSTSDPGVTQPPKGRRP